jgi:hypothetical protein
MSAKATAAKAPKPTKPTAAAPVVAKPAVAAAVEAPKAKAKKADAPKAEAPKVEAPKAAAADAPKAPKAAKAAKETKEPKEPKAPKAEADGASRTQLASVLHINISQARCATHLKQHLSDEAVEAQVRDLKASLKAADPAAAAAIGASIAALAKKLVRISSETPIAVAVVWDCAVKELLRGGMDAAIAADRKIVDVGHVHEANAPLLPLYNKCAIWAEHSNAAKEGAAAPAEAEVVAEEDGKNSFYTYVENALKTVKAEDKYKTMRVSNRVREYLAELVAQGIARHTLLSRIIVQRIVGVRTMNADHVKVVASMLMADAGAAAGVVALTDTIDAKLALYQAHLRSEREKKAKALDPAQLAEIACRQGEQALARKKKQAETLKKRAIESAGQAKALNAEVAALEPQVSAARAAVGSA